MTELLINIFYATLYQPLFNVLIFVYQNMPGNDLGIAVIFLTIAIRLLLYPSSVQSIKSQKIMSEIQPLVKDIQRKYKDDKEKMAKEMMALYKEKKMNPFAGIFPLLVQIPILIALFLIIKNIEGGLDDNELRALYPFISSPEIAKPFFLGMINLTIPSLFLAVLAGGSQFLQTKMLAPKAKSKGTNDFSQLMQTQMTYVFPFITVFICWKLPAALALYWITTSLFSVAQQHIVLKNN